MDITGEKKQKKFTKFNSNSCKSLNTVAMAVKALSEDYSSRISGYVKIPEDRLLISFGSVHMKLKKR